MLPTQVIEEEEKQDSSGNFGDLPKRAPEEDKEEEQKTFLQKQGTAFRRGTLHR